MCLFHVLLDMAAGMNLTIHPVHVNHKFRPGAAEADQEFVERVSREAGLTCSSFVYDCNKIAVKEKITSEEAGRNARYEAFSKVAAKLTEEGVNPEMIRIAVAQNADDQAETILFRILRGVGTDGLSGISYKRRDENGNVIIRPLLDVSKANILAFCLENNITTCVDATNDQPLYTRNKIRLELIPYLEKEYNANIKDTMIRLGKISSIDKDFLWCQAHEEFMTIIKEKSSNTMTLNGERLRTLHRAIRQRVVSLALSEIGLCEDVSYAHFEGCEEIIFNQKPSARLDLPGGYYITKVYDDVRVVGIERQLAKDERLEVRLLSKTEFEKEKLLPNKHLALDKDKVLEALGEEAIERFRLRNRQPGDYIAIGEGNRKKLQDFFVDQKIPKDQRNQIQLIGVDYEILWVVPGINKGRYTVNYRVESTTKSVICIEIIGSI